MISINSPVFAAFVLLAAYGLIMLIATMLERILRKKTHFPDVTRIKVIVAVKNADEYIECAADEIIKKWWDELPLKEGMLYFCDCGSDDDTPEILERLAKSRPYISIINYAKKTEGSSESISRILEFDV